jgi:quercetin dioxygenase-like cupin family protein
MLRPVNSTTLTPELARGECFALTGDHYKVVATAADTGGTMFAIEVTVSPGGGPPPHVHAHEDETFYVLEGELEVWVAGTLRRLRAGELAFGPRNIPHRFRNPTNRPVRILVQVFPGYAGRFFAEVARPLPAAGAPIPPPTEDEIRHLLATAAQHGITILPPS